MIIYNYGALDAAEADVVLPFDNCTDAWNCLDDGEHDVQIVAEIAGEDMGPDPLDTSFTVDCPGSDAALGCDIGSLMASTSPRPRAPHRGFIATIMCAVFIRRRLRRATGKQQHEPEQRRDGRASASAFCSRCDTPSTASKSRIMN